MFTLYKILKLIFKYVISAPRCAGYSLTFSDINEARDEITKTNKQKNMM